MHLYDTTDKDVVKGRPKFWITIAVISVATWTIAGLGYWVVRAGKKETLKNFFKIKKATKKEIKEGSKPEEKKGFGRGTFRRRQGNDKGKGRHVEV
jgi:hypothetical protein